jgi:hypothetical protein
MRTGRFIQVSMRTDAVFRSACYLGVSSRILRSKRRYTKAGSAHLPVQEHVLVGSALRAFLSENMCSIFGAGGVLPIWK